MKKRLLSWFLAMVMVLGLLPATAWAETIPFTAAAGEETLEIEKSSEEYQYTVVTEYDEYWNPVKTEERTVPLYEVKVPADAEQVTLDFGAERLAYAYDEDGNYVAAYAKEGAYADNGQTGETTAVVADGFGNYVRVQIPYDDEGNSEFLYAIHLLTEEDTSESEYGEVSVEELLKSIAKSYEEVSEDGWIIMEMVAYEDLNLDDTKTSDEAKQKYINSAITSVADENAGETTYTKAILALTAIGIDAEELYPENSITPISAIAGLNDVEHGSGAWVAPYTLAVYGQKDYAGTEETVDAIIAAVLANQQDDGSRSEWGDSIQTTSNMIAGLSFYYGENEAVTAAVDKAVEFLSDVQKEEGSFDAYGSGADANTAAMVVIGLSALGINPDADQRFEKDGVSVLDALLRFALKDNSGFGYTDNTTQNSYATEQAFRALIAAKQMMDTGEAFNIYDFSYNTELEAGYFEKTEEKPPVDKPTEEDEITVTVSIDANGNDWLDEKSVTVAEDATVYDAFINALKGTGITQKGAANGYIESMTKDGKTYGEFTSGDNSGWLYKVNGKLPDVGIKDYNLEDGDDILFYYTEDWKKDPDAGSRYEKEEEILEEPVEEEIQEEIYQELPVLEEIYTDISADHYYYEAAQWAVGNRIVSVVWSRANAGKTGPYQNEIWIDRMKRRCRDTPPFSYFVLQPFFCMKK